MNKNERYKITFLYMDLIESCIQANNSNLYIYETSTERLAKKFGDRILETPISVTMCGVEYQGLIKEGGLAEAIEGMAQGLLKQHSRNIVRLIFPKFSILPKHILEQLEKTPRLEHKDSEGRPFTSCA